MQCLAYFLQSHDPDVEHEQHEQQQLQLLHLEQSFELQFLQFESQHAFAIHSPFAFAIRSLYIHRTPGNDGAQIKSNRPKPLSQAGLR